MPVILHPYRADLPNLYQKEKERILSSISSIRNIHHIGSSAIFGTSGKNEIDIVIGLKEYKELEKLTKEFEKIGYHTKWIDYENEWTFLCSRPHDSIEGDFNIHITRYGNNRYKNFLIFRDFLRGHNDEKERYEKLKSVWLKKSKGVSMVYAKLKTKYIQSVLEKAIKE